MRGAALAIAAVLLAACGGGGDRTARNTLLVSDILIFDRIQGDGRIRSSCAGDRCTLRVGAATTTFSISDVADVPPFAPTVDTLGAINGLTLTRTADVLEIEDVGATSAVAYGAWMEAGSFAVIYAPFDEGPYRGVTMTFGATDGYSTDTDPVSGAATWNGAMVGNVFGTPSIVGGEATLTMDFGSRDMDVLFSDIRYIQYPSGTPVDRYVPSREMAWSDLPVGSGGFRGQGIEGRFYGAEHEAVGGVFERQGLVGAFGAKR